MTDFEFKTYELIDAYHTVIDSITLLEDEIDMYMNYSEIKESIKILNESENSLEKDILRSFSEIKNDTLKIKKYHYDDWFNLLIYCMDKNSNLASLANGDRWGHLKSEVDNLLIELEEKNSKLQTLNSNVGNSCKKAIDDSIIILKKMKNILTLCKEWFGNPRYNAHNDNCIMSDETCEKLIQLLRKLNN